MTCSVCSHPQRQVIDSLIAVGVPSQRVIASQFNLKQAAIDRHKRSGHLGQRIAKAIERSEAKADDVFMERHEHLYRETLQYVEDAKGAVKMQRVTVEVPDGDPDLGKTKLQERYQAFRDVGAMAPALQTAVQLQRVLGDATARFSQTGATVNVDRLMIVLPREAVPPAQVVDVTPGRPAIDATCEPLPLVVDNNPSDDTSE